MDERIAGAVDAVFAVVREVAAARPRDWERGDHSTAWVELYEIELLEDLRLALPERIRTEQQVALARGRGRSNVSWADVGDALGVSRQSAHERLGY